MRAVICEEYGPPERLVMTELPSPTCGAGQVKIAVHACGVNFPDTLIIQNKYQFKPPLPFAPGGEVAGEIIEVGPNVRNVAVGDRVIAMVGWGGYADELVAEAATVMPIPAGMSYVVAAGFTMVYGTSHYALKQRAELRAGETLLVLGAAGGVGLSAVELGKLMGARVIAAASTDEKLALCKEYGADEVLNYSKESIKDRTKALTGGAGADVIYDAVGGDVLEKSLRCVAWDGRVLVIGFASGEIPKLAANLVLLKNAALVGVFWGAWVSRARESNRANFETMFQWYNEGKLKPIVSHTFPLTQAKDALYAIVQRQVVGKCVIITKPQGTSS